LGILVEVEFGAEDLFSFFYLEFFIDVRVLENDGFGEASNDDFVFDKDSIIFFIFSFRGKKDFFTGGGNNIRVKCDFFFGIS
jgi:hypothetical protein